jgi:hypothetical protein
MARLGVAGSSRNRSKWIAKVASSTIEPNYSEIKGLRSGDAESLGVFERPLRLPADVLIYPRILRPVCFGVDRLVGL